MTRFDTRLTKEQKAFFEYASMLGGYRSLTDFFLSTVQAKATEIVQEHNRVIASTKDQEIFFSHVTQPAMPNDALKAALEAYKKITD